MVAYLSVINNPSDTVRLKRIINEPKRSIGDATVSSVEQIALQTGIPVFDVLKNANDYGVLARKASQLTAFASMIEQLRDAALTKPLDELLDDIMELTGYNLMLHALGEEGKTRLENIGELKSTLVKYETGFWRKLPCIPTWTA